MTMKKERWGMIKQLIKLISLFLVFNLISSQISFAEKKVIHVKVKRSEILKQGLEKVKVGKKAAYKAGTIQAIG